MRTKSRRLRKLAAELFETRCLLSAVPAGVTGVADPAGIYAEKEGWEHIDFEEIHGVAHLLDAAGLQATDMAFLRNDEGHILARGHTSEIILDAVVSSIEAEQLSPSLYTSVSSLSPSPQTLTLLPDLTSIKALPGFPEQATLTVSPVSVGGESLGTSITVWEHGAAGEPSTVWEPLDVRSWLPGDNQNADIESSFTSPIELIDIGEISVDYSVETPTFQPALLGRAVQDFSDSDTGSIVPEYFVSSGAYSSDSQPFKFLLSTEVLDATYPSLQFGVGVLSVWQNATPSSNPIGDDVSFQSEFADAGNVPFAEASTDLVVQASFDVPAALSFDTPIAASSIVTPSSFSELAVTPSPVVNRAPTLAPTPAFVDPTSGVITPLKPTLVGQSVVERSSVTLTPPTRSPEVSNSNSIDFYSPPSSIDRQPPTTVVPPNVSFETTKPLVDLSDVTPTQSNEPVVSTPLEQTPTLQAHADTVSSDPAILKLNVPAATVSTEALTEVEEFLESAKATTESLVSTDTVVFPLSLEQVELVDEHVDVGDDSRQIRISPAEDDFIDIGSVTDPDVMAAFYSSADIEAVLASAPSEESQTIVVETSADEIGNFGSARRFESGEPVYSDERGEFQDASSPARGQTTTPVTAWEADKHAGDTIRTSLPSSTSQVLVARMTQHLFVANESIAVTSQAVSSLQDVSRTSAIEVETLSSDPLTEDELENESPTQTQVARSSMVGSALVVLFGATYFELRRVKDRSEQAATIHRRSLEQLGHR